MYMIWSSAHNLSSNRMNIYSNFPSSSVCKNKIGNRDYEQRIYFSNTFFKKPIMNIFTQTQPSQSQGTLNKKKLFEIA